MITGSNSQSFAVKILVDQHRGEPLLAENGTDPSVEKSNSERPAFLIRELGHRGKIRWPKRYLLKAPQNRMLILSARNDPIQNS